MRNKRISNFVLLSILLTLTFQPQQQVAANPGVYFLRLPFNNLVRINAIFDHQFPSYAKDGYITIFNGDSRVDHEPYFYDGHSGTDFNLNTGTDVLAAADGVIQETKNNWAGQPAESCGNYVKIDHQNGYKTLYCHLTSVSTSIYVGATVVSGDIIGSSGDTGSTGQAHLHFEVFQGPLSNSFYSTDPFGWSGDYPDPLVDWPTSGMGKSSQCLWRSSSFDLVSCNDTWLQDSGMGFGSFGNGTGFQAGNGSHVTTTYNIDNPNYVAFWNPPNFRRGLFRLLAFIPWGSANSTAMAHYSIWTEYGWEYVTLDQTINTENWVALGHFLCFDDCFVVLNAQTSEPPWQKIVIADDIKFREFKYYLPVIEH